MFAPIAAAISREGKVSRQPFAFIWLKKRSDGQIVRRPGTFRGIALCRSRRSIAKHAGSEQSLILSKYIHQRESLVLALQAKIQTLLDSAGYCRIRDGGLEARLALDAAIIASLSRQMAAKDGSTPVSSVWILNIDILITFDSGGALLLVWRAPNRQ
jgi:hypothetical protein